jgi:hypothetical protein
MFLLIERNIHLCQSEQFRKNFKKLFIASSESLFNIELLRKLYESEVEITEAHEEFKRLVNDQQENQSVALDKEGEIKS